MKSLAAELTDSGLMTCAVLPGSVDTEMLVGSGFPPRMSPESVAQTLVHYAFDAPLAHNGGEHRDVRDLSGRVQAGTSSSRVELARSAPALTDSAGVVTGH